MQYLENATDTLVFENDFIRREITFRNGRPVASALTRLDSGYTWRSAKEAPVLHLPGFDWSMAETTYEDGIVTFRSNYIVRWVFTTAENTPAICSQLFARALPTEETGVQCDLDDIAAFEPQTAAREQDITDRIFHTGNHVRLDRVRFFDRTDHVDSLIREEQSYLYRGEECFDGEAALICTIPEGHVHGELCYDENWHLICGVEEHLHANDCRYACGKQEHIHTASSGVMLRSGVP